MLWILELKIILKNQKLDCLTQWVYKQAKISTSWFEIEQLRYFILTKKKAFYFKI